MSKTIELARAVLIRSFLDDPDFRQIYVDNIACCLMDEQNRAGKIMNMNNPEHRNKYAESIMNHLFKPDDDLTTDEKIIKDIIK